MTEQRRAWILYDGRAEFGDPDDAAVLEFAGTTRGQVKNCLWHWKDDDGFLVEYDDEGGELRNERKVGHLRDGVKALLRQCNFARRAEGQS